MSIKKQNKKLLNKLNSAGRWKYWDIFDREIQKFDEEDRLDNAQTIIRSCKADVEDRAESNGKQLDQVRPAVAGRYFQAFIASTTISTASENGYRVLHNPKLSKNPELKNASLEFNDTEIEPDTDIVYYEPDADSPILIFSCKTSLRERLAQSGMWKIIYETAGHDCSDTDCPTHNYSFSGTLDRDIYLGFITMDWYDEVERNDIVDMMDLGYVADTTNVDRSANIYPLPELTDHIESGWNFL